MAFGIRIVRELTDSKQQVTDYYHQGTDRVFMRQSSSIFSNDETELEGCVLIVHAAWNNV